MRLSGSPSSVSGNWLRVPSWVSKCSPEMLISTRWWCMALRLAAFIPSSSPAAAMVMPWRWPPSSGGSISAAGPERGACGCGWGPDAARPLMLPSLLLQRLPPPPRGVGGSLSRSSSTCGGGEGGGVPSLPSLSLGTNVDPEVWSSSLCRRALVLPLVLPAVAYSTDDMAPPPPFSRVTSAISMGSSGSRRAPMRWRASCARRLAAASHLRTGGRPPCPPLPQCSAAECGRARPGEAGQGPGYERAIILMAWRQRGCFLPGGGGGSLPRHRTATAPPAPQVVPTAPVSQPSHYVSAAEGTTVWPRAGMYSLRRGGLRLEFLGTSKMKSRAPFGACPISLPPQLNENKERDGICFALLPSFPLP